MHRCFQPQLIGFVVDFHGLVFVVAVSSMVVAITCKSIPSIPSIPPIPSITPKKVALVLIRHCIHTYNKNIKHACSYTFNIQSDPSMYVQTVVGAVKRPTCSIQISRTIANRCPVLTTAPRRHRPLQLHWLHRRTVRRTVYTVRTVCTVP
jgi:hypothetical protein